MRNNTNPMDKYDSDTLIQEAELREEYGEFQRWDLMEFTAKDLYAEVERRKKCCWLKC